MQREDVVIVGARRTAIGDFGGCFRDLPSLELARVVVEEVVRETGLDKRQIDEVIFGNCNQRTDEPNIARCIALTAGMPVETTGFTIQRQCSSGMQAIASAYQEIILGDTEIVVAGGVESMSTAPYLPVSYTHLKGTLEEESGWEVLVGPREAAGIAKFAKETFA